MCPTPLRAALDLTPDERKWLKELPYAEFLQTEFWKIVRSLVYARAGNRCEICYSPERLNAHHKTYIHHGWEDQYLGDLICMCFDCHELFETRLGRRRYSAKPASDFNSTLFQP